MRASPSGACVRASIDASCAPPVCCCALTPVAFVSAVLVHPLALALSRTLACDCSAVLSAAGSPHAEAINEAELDGNAALAAALMLEAAKRGRSAWAGYIDSLPRGMAAELPSGWCEQDVALLAGTELAGAPDADREECAQEYHEHIVPLVTRLLAEEPALDPSLLRQEHYAEALALVTSRQFHVDDFHGHAMVPFGDILNHKTARLNVDLQEAVVSRPACEGGEEDSEEDEESVEDELDGEDRATAEAEERRNHSAAVGSLVPSLSARAGRSTRASGAAGMDVTFVDVGDALQVVTHRSLRRGLEVFNCYGEIASGTLLHDYGFVPDANPFDIVNIETSDLIEACAEEFGPRLVRARLRALGDVSALPEYIELGRLEAGLPAETVGVVKALCGDSDERCDELSRGERRALAASVAERESAYGRSGGAAGDRRRAIAALDCGNVHAAQAFRLAAAERSILETWMDVLNTGGGAGAKRKRRAIT